MYGLCGLMVVNLKQDEVIIWIPKPFSVEYKIETVSDSVTTDVTADFINTECVLIATNGIGDFSLTLDNNTQVYNDFYSGGEIVNVYIDYSDGTHKIFSGVIENTKKKLKGGSNTLELTGGYIASELIDITVTASYTDTVISTILTDIFTTYFPLYTLTNVATTTTTASISWEHKPVWEGVVELCNLAGFDCYVDVDKDVHFFLKESVTNNDEGVIESDTLIEEDGLADTRQNIKNKVIVNGQEIEGMPIIATAEDTTSQTSVRVKESVINDEDITSTAEAQQRADNELLLLKNKIIEGKVLCYGLPKLNPAELVYVDIPTQNISAKYRVAKIVHKLDIYSGALFTSEVFLENEPKVLQHIFKERIKTEREQRKAVNANNMKYSYVFPFNSTSEAETVNNTQIIAGKLKLTAGQSTGNMTTATFTASDTVTEVELRCNVSDDCVVGTTLKTEVSCDNGISWTNITGVGFNGKTGTKTSILSSKQGTKIDIKVTLTSTATYINPELESLAILYN